MKRWARFGGVQLRSVVAEAVRAIAVTVTVRVHADRRAALAGPAQVVEIITVRPQTLTAEGRWCMAQFDVAVAYGRSCS